jgi:uncharacterized protein (TIGR00375 family)
MKYIADLHIHSHYALATSKHLTPEYLDLWAQIKGIDVLATGDCTHPGWLKELKEKLEPAGNGFYRLKEKYKLKNLPHGIKTQVNFVLQGEISSIYKKNGKVRKVHNLCILPDFKSAEKLQKNLKKVGNIESDGRPILGFDSRNVLETVLNSGNQAFVIPAHIWTPWFSVLGEKSGFDSIDECYGDLANEIFALETGLSSDPAMNRLCSFLDRYSLVSNSDAHSPEKLGREANIFDTGLSYKEFYQALKSGNGLASTIEFFPQEGKYHYDGHRNCKVSLSPEETKKCKGICPVCKKPLTRGVASRVEDLQDRKNINAFKGKMEFSSITSLPAVISEVMSCGTASKKVKEKYLDIINKVGSEFYILLYAKEDEISRGAGEIFAEAIKRLRAGKVYIQEGFDGEFGKIKVFSAKEIAHIKGMPHGV